MNNLKKNGREREEGGGAEEIEVGGKKEERKEGRRKGMKKEEEKSQNLMILSTGKVTEVKIKASQCSTCTLKYIKYFTSAIFCASK